MPAIPPAEAIVTMWPSPAAIIRGRNARTVQNDARMLTSNVRSISSSEASVSVLPVTTPALLTSTVTVPTSCSTRCAVALIASRSQRSTA